MNKVQKNFKKQIKQVEREKLKDWKKEKYHDRYTGKNYIRYYNECGQLMKTKERKFPSDGLKKFLIVLGIIIGVISLLFAICLILLIFVL